MSTTQVTVVTGHRSARRAAAARNLAGRMKCARVPASAVAHADDDAAIEALRIITSGAPQNRIVLELPADASVESTIAIFEESEDTVVAELVCVIDAGCFFDDLMAEEYWQISGSRPSLFVARALRLVQHIEHASVLLVAGWGSVETRDLSVLLATLSHLAPAARIRLDRTASDAPPAVFTQSTHQPGWVHLLNDEHRPHMSDIRVSAFRYEQLRPFHPGRLHRFLETRFGTGEFGAVVRSAGFCRLATRPGIVGSWDQVGQMISLEPLARDAHPSGQLLALGQDIAIIGIDLDAASLTAALDATAISDAEFLTAGADWSRFADPFPRWTTAVSADE